MSTIFELFQDELTVMKRGEQHLESNDLMEFRWDEGFVHAKVAASMKKCIYDVEVIKLCGRVQLKAK